MADRTVQDPAAARAEGVRRMFPRFADQAERFAHYAKMRHEHPVVGDEETGVWSVYRFADVRRVLSDFETFSSEAAFAPPPGAQGGGPGGPAGRGPGPRPSVQQPSPAPTAAAAHGAEPAARRPGGFLLRTLLNSDPPRHTHLRSLVTRSFTPKAVARMEPLVRKLTRQALEPALQRGSMEVMSELARPVPILVIADLLGLPAEDEARFRDWAETFNGTQDPAAPPEDPASFQGRFQRMQQEMDEYFTPLIERKRRAPGGDLVSDLTHAEVEGERLSPEELMAFCQLLLLAGFVTTTNLIGSGFWLLGQHPEAYAALQADTGHAPGCVEEVLRFSSPVQAFLRRAARPVEIGGRTIPADARVIAWIGSANHDEQTFPDPEAFLLDRDPNPHVAFGHGIHFCLGAPLARLEGRVVFEELAKRATRLELSEPASTTFSEGFLYGPTRLAVSLRAG